MSGSNPKVMAAAVIAAIVCVSGAGYGVWKSSGGQRGTVMSAATAAREARGGGERSGRDEASGGGGEGAEWNSDGLEEREGGVRREVAGNGAPVAPAWVEQAERLTEAGELAGYTDHASVSAAASSLDQASLDLENRFAGSDSVDGSTIAQRTTLAQTWLGFVRPVIAADREAFEAFVEGLGIVEPEEGAVGDDGEAVRSSADRLYDQFAPFLEGASLGVVSTGPRPVSLEDPRAVPSVPSFLRDRLGEGPLLFSMVEQMQERNDETGEEVTRVARQIPLQGVFGEAAVLAEGGARIVEVSSPFRMAGTRAQQPDGVIGLFFVWDRDGRRWLPLAARLVLLSEKARNAS